MDTALVLLTVAVVGVLTALVLPLIGRGPGRRSLAIVIAGADPRFIVSAADRTWLTSAGCMVFLTAAAGGASMVAALSIVFADTTSPWAFLPIGLLWGAIVLTLDRWIVSARDHGPIEAGEQHHPWRRFTASAARFGVRLVMATVIGLVISEPIILKIFAPEIAAQVQADQEQTIRERTKEINADFANRDTDPTGDVDTAKKTYDNAVAAESLTHQIYLCELYPTPACIAALPPGTISGVPGQGPQTEQAYTAWQTALAAVQPAREAYDRALDVQRTGVSAPLETQRLQAIADMTARVEADNGLLAQERALSEVIAADSSLATRRWVLMGAILLVDLMPLLLTVLSPRSQYTRLERAAAVRRVRNVSLDAEEESDTSLLEQRAGRGVRLHTSGNVLSNLVEQRDVTESERAQRAEERAEATQARRAARAAANPTGAAQGREADPANDETTPEHGGPRSRPDPVGYVIKNRWAVERALAGVSHSTRYPPYIGRDLLGQYEGPVVIKVIADPPGKGDPREHRRALNEMAMPVGELHPHVAPVYASDIDPVHGCFIVTPYYKRTLQDYLLDPANAGKITLLQSLTWLRQILDGLSAAWLLGYVHLDIKPANIGLDDDLQVKIFDFGLLRNYMAVNSNLGTSNQPSYTALYAPPEQMDRSGEWISRSADLYAVAATFYRIVTGWPPLYLEAVAAKLIDPDSQVLLNEDLRFDLKELSRKTNPVGLTQLLPDLPRDVAFVIARWLDRVPDMRNPGDPDGFVARLQMYVDAMLDEVVQAGVGNMVVGPTVVREVDLTFDLRRRGWPSRARREQGPDAGGMPAPATNGHHHADRSGPAHQAAPTFVPSESDDSEMRDLGIDLVAGQTAAEDPTTWEPSDGAGTIHTGTGGRNTPGRDPADGTPLQPGGPGRFSVQNNVAADDLIVRLTGDRRLPPPPSPRPDDMPAPTHPLRRQPNAAHVYLDPPTFDPDAGGPATDHSGEVRA
jgi:serine/threonine protein kinase